MKILKNKKVMIALIAVVTIIIATVVGLIIYTGVLKKNKMVKYLSSVGYTCYRDKSYGHQKTCTRTKNGEEETVTFTTDYFNVRYTIKVSNEVKMVIDDSYYTRTSEHNIIKVSINEGVLDDTHGVCIFIPYRIKDDIDWNIKWKVGDKVFYHEPFSLHCDSDYTYRVNKMIKEFESYFAGAKIKLK